MSKRGHYLGGHTVIGGRRRGFSRLTNTAPQHIPSDPHATPVFIDGRIADDVQEELSNEWSFNMAADLIAAVESSIKQHELGPFLDIAKEWEAYHGGGYLLRVSNKLIEGKQFTRVKGEFTIKGTGGWRFNKRQLRGLVKALHASHDPECDELPELSDALKSLIA